MILVLDNYDSFTYNLVQYLGEYGNEIEVVRNDKASADELLDMKPSHIVVSPGPCTPREAGISVELIKKVKDIPLLGICLGHQCIAAAFGGKIVRAPYIMHGKVSKIIAYNCPILRGFSTVFTATRYHSLIVEKKSLPKQFVITAETEDKIIMGIQHKTLPLFGLQFHPESILTQPGMIIIKNFLRLEG